MNQLQQLQAQRAKLESERAESNRRYNVMIASLDDEIRRLAEDRRERPFSYGPIRKIGRAVPRPEGEPYPQTWEHLAALDNE